jgi:hypothetical protein
MYVEVYWRGLVKWLSSGLTDGFGYILEGLGMENVGIFYDHLEYFTVIRYIMYMAVWYGFPFLVCLDLEKSGNPGLVWYRNSKPSYDRWYGSYVDSKPFEKTNILVSNAFISLFNTQTMHTKSYTIALLFSLKKNLTP